MTVTYAEKGYGLHLAIHAAGHWIEQSPSGLWLSDDDVAVQAIIDGYTLDQVKADVAAKIEAHAADLRNKVVAGISPGEMASWSIKRSEAYAYQASGNAADAPTLNIEATTRGVALTDVVTRVLANAGTLAGLEATIAGVSGKHKDAIKGLSTFADVLAYDWHTDWPAV